MIKFVVFIEGTQVRNKYPGYSDKQNMSKLHSTQCNDMSKSNNLFSTIIIVMLR